MGMARAAAATGRVPADGEPRGGGAHPPLRGAVVTRGSYSRGSLAWLIVLLVTGALVAGLYLTDGKREEIESVAILPVDLGADDPDTQVLGDALREGLVVSLGGLPRLRVVVGQGPPEGSAVAAGPLDAGRQLGVAAVITGHAVRQADTLAVSAELVTVADGVRHWGASFVRPASDLFAVQEELASQVAAALRPELGAAVRQAMGHRPTESLNAYLLYLKGRRRAGETTVHGLETAIACFTQAIHDDPSFALARDALAECTRALERAR